jgi:protoheme IX farnesyltransferase
MYHLLIRQQQQQLHHHHHRVQKNLPILYNKDEILSKVAISYRLYVLRQTLSTTPATAAAAATPPPPPTTNTSEIMNSQSPTTTTIPITNHKRITTSSKSSFQTFSELIKLRLSTMVVASSSAGYLLAGPPYSIHQFLAVTLGTSLAAASASTLNQIYERKTDGMMKRTAHRPLPSGKVSVETAKKTALALGISSIGMLGTFTNPLTTMLGAINIGLYAGVYTPMKQISIWNTWVGAVVGAIPPLMGYATATGTILAAPPLLLGTSLFFWQFPHFFALSWLLRRDYARGGYKMLVCVDPQGKATSSVMTRYAVANSGIPFIAYGLDVTSIMFPIESLVYNGAMIWACNKFQQSSKDEDARRVFRLSLVYLPLLMISFVFHAKEDRRKEMSDARVIWNQRQNNDLTFLDRARNIAREYCPHEWTIIRNRLTPNHTSEKPGSVNSLSSSDSTTNLTTSNNFINNKPSSSSSFPIDHEGFCPHTSLRASLEVIAMMMAAHR